MVYVQGSLSMLGTLASWKPSRGTLFRTTNSGPPDKVIYSYLSQQVFCCRNVHRCSISPPLHQSYQQPESRCEHSKGSQQQRCLDSSVPEDGRQQGCWRSGSRTDRNRRSLSYSMLEQYRLPGGQEHRSRSAGTGTDTDTDSVQREEHRAEKNNTTSNLGSGPESHQHLRQTLPTKIQPTRGPMRGQPIAVRRSGPHKHRATQIVCELRSYEIFLPSQENSIFNPPVFQVSSWLTLLSQTPVCMVQLLLEVFKCFVPLCSGNV